MIHTILVILVLICFFVLSIPMLLIEWIIGKISPHAQEVSSLRIVQATFKLILAAAGTKVTIIGEENIPQDTPVLYIGNHRSYFDVVLTYSRCPGLTGYIAKKEFEKIPLLSNWMRHLHCLFLDRQDLKQGLKTILAAIDMVKSGISVFVYPEGTRNKNESDLDLLPFHEGSFKVATKSGCPIIPVAITNAADIWENHKPWVKSQHVVMEYLPPIYPDQLDKQAQRHLGAYTQELIREAIRKNQEAA